MPRKQLGMLIVAASAAGFGASTIFIKLAYAAGANVSTMLSTRFLLAALILLVGLKLRGRSLRVSPKLAIRLILIGFIFYNGMSVLLANALLHLSAPLTILLFYTYPVLVGLLSACLGEEKISFINGAALFICLAGLALILGVSFSGINLIGVAAAIAAAVMYAGFMVASSKLLKEVDSMVTTTYIVLVSGLTFFSYGLATGTLIGNLPPQGWLALLGVAICSTVIGVFGLLAGVGMLGATTAAIISNFEPVVTVLLAAALLGENITLAQAGGGLLIIAGIITFQLKPTDAASPEPAPSGQVE